MIKAVKPLFTLSALALAVTSISAQAEENFRQHGAHVHGSVEFNIAQDGQDLLVEIIAPGADVVGFEHAPKTDEQKQQLESAIATLNKADSILTFTQAAGCEVQSAEISHTLGQDDHDDHGHDHDKHDHHDDHKGHDHGEHDHHDDHKGHDHSEHDHHDDHKGHDHDEHDHHDDHKDHDHDDHAGHDHHDHEHGEGGHGEFNIAYQFQCKDVSKLSQIDTAWFDLFPSTERVNVNLLTDNAQVATELVKNNTVIKL